MNQIRITRASEENLSQVSLLFDAYRQFYKQPADLERSTAFLKERIQNNESVIFLACDANGHAVGFTQLYPLFSSTACKRTWLLNDLFVTKSARRLGVGKKLMEAARQFATQAGACALSLATQVENTNAQALYEQLGYQRRDDFYHYVLTL